MTLGSPAAAAAASAFATTRRRGRLAIVGTTVLLAVAVLLSIGTGPVGVPPLTVARIVAAHLLPGEHVATWTPAQDQIVWTFRLPRVLMALLVGAALAVVGSVLQAIVRNPLADPYVLGASSGAALGAVGALALGASVPGLLVSGSAFTGAAVAGIVVYVLASRGGRIESLRLVLAGVALSYLFSAVTGWITATADHGKLPGLLFFLLGSISSASWEMLTLPAVALVLGLVWAVRRSRPVGSER